MPAVASAMPRPLASSLPVLIATVIFNTLIAVFLSAIGVGSGESGFVRLLPDNMIWSQCIGLSVCGLVLLVLQANLTGALRIVAMLGAVTAGAAIGVTLAPILTGSAAVPELATAPWQAMVIGVFFGGIASAFFWLRERNANLSKELETRELARLEAEKRSIEAQLKMLQAQIEPHFLFNTLANVASLIRREPPLAGSLLDALIRYLRASLMRTRAEGGTLGDEMALLRAYLEVLSIRMGERLRYEFDVAPELLSTPFPPMLLQPLVENAIHHGLECKVEGGMVRVVAQRIDGMLNVTVSDDGLGISETAPASVRPGSGLGLANIRARLAALYGSRGRLTLTTKVGAGVTAVVSLPAGGDA
jgi:signal transduction histidine kinase